VLDLTRDLDQWQTLGSPREARAHTRRLYDEDRWLGQKYFPLLVVEKDTMEPVCKPMAERSQMPFASSRGYGSLKLQYDVAEMIGQRRAQTGQLAVWSISHPITTRAGWTYKCHGRRHWRVSEPSPLSNASLSPSSR
jgi:hypothetical protein